MWDVILKVANNAGMGFEYIVVLVYMLGSIIIAAKDVRIALIVNFVISASVFVWFYTQDLNYRPVVITFFITLVALSFTLYVTGRDTAARGIT